jgi:hypothetical protein
MIASVRGVMYADFSQSGSDDHYLRMFEYYTRAWFDRYLNNETPDTARLLASSVDAKPRGALLRVYYHRCC